MTNVRRSAVRSSKQANSERPLIAAVAGDPAVRTWLCTALARSGYRCVSFASTDEYFQAQSADRSSCVALLDVHLPGVLGRQYLVRAGGSLQATAVVTITTESDIAAARKALHGTTPDFIGRSVDQQEILAAVKDTVRRNRMQQVSASNANEARDRLGLLTEREREVFFRITDGKRNNEIAAELTLSVRTVEVHRANLMKKLHAPRLADLIRLREAIAEDADDGRAGPMPPDGHNASAARIAANTSN